MNESLLNIIDEMYYDDFIAELSVLESMIELYEKQDTILEYCKDKDAFSFYTEMENGEVKETDTDNSEAKETDTDNGNAAQAATGNGEVESEVKGDAKPTDTNNSNSSATAPKFVKIRKLFHFIVSLVEKASAWITGFIRKGSREKFKENYKKFIEKNGAAAEGTAESMIVNLAKVKYLGAKMSEKFNKDHLIASDDSTIVSKDDANKEIQELKKLIGINSAADLVSAKAFVEEDGDSLRTFTKAKTKVPDVEIDELFKNLDTYRNRHEQMHNIFKLYSDELKKGEEAFKKTYLYRNFDVVIRLLDAYSKVYTKSLKKFISLLKSIVKADVTVDGTADGNSGDNTGNEAESNDNVLYGCFVVPPIEDGGIKIWTVTYTNNAINTNSQQIIKNENSCEQETQFFEDITKDPTSKRNKMLRVILQFNYIECMLEGKSFNHKDFFTNFATINDFYLSKYLIDDTGDINSNIKNSIFNRLTTAEINSNRLFVSEKPILTTDEPVTNETKTPQQTNSETPSSTESSFSSSVDPGVDAAIQNHEYQDESYIPTGENGDGIYIIKESAEENNNPYDCILYSIKE